MKINYPEDENFYQKMKFFISGLHRKFVPKDKLLDSYIKNIRIFDDLDENQLSKLKKQLSAVSFKKGGEIINQGDLGDKFYIVKNGSVTVYIRNPVDHSEIILARLETGEYFGEQALLDEAPGARSSSVKALEDCELYAIPHDVYVSITTPEIKKKLKKIGEKQLLDSFLHIQESISSIDQTILKDCSGEIKKYSNGNVIFKLGDKADLVYFIISGNVEIEIPSENGVNRTELGSGSLFGELGIMNQKERAGSAIAKGPLVVFALNRISFEKLYQNSKELRDYLKSLKHIYQVSHRGTVKIYYGKLLGLNAVMSVYNLENGSTVTTAKTIGNLAFTLSYNDNQKGETFNYTRGSEIRRKLDVKDRKITGITVFGDWSELSEVCNLSLNSEKITDKQIESFLATGNLGIKKLTVLSDLEKEEIVCKCMKISKGQIYELISQGHNRLNEITEKLGAGSVCGTCRPKIVELIGLKAWHTVKFLEKIPLRQDICAFRFKLSDNDHFGYKPGQYVVISALINGVFINRSYTLTSVFSKDPYIEITVKREPQGYFSAWLFEKANEDSVIRISDATGAFIPSENPEIPIVCFVGGIGVTPAVAFARSASTTKRRVHVDYSDQHKEDFILQDVWRNLTHLNSNISIEFRATRKVGKVQPEHLQKIANEFPNADFFVCGPDSFERFIVSQLAAQKIPASKVKTERFIHAGSGLSI